MLAAIFLLLIAECRCNERRRQEGMLRKRQTTPMANDANNDIRGVIHTKISENRQFHSTNLHQTNDDRTSNLFLLLLLLV